MKLKTATLVAILGMALYTLTHLFYLLSNFIHIRLAPIFWGISSIFNLFAVVSLLLFFIVMYDKQQ